LRPVTNKDISIRSRRTEN